MLLSTCSHAARCVRRATDIDAGWAAALAPVRARIDGILADLDGTEYLPAPDRVLAAFDRPFADVRVLIVGQDPYPTPGHAIGLSFATAKHVRPLPASLRNIYAELRGDLGIEAPSHGDLTPWADQGVLLLNRVLTVAPGAAGSHRRRGWEDVTDQAIRALAARDAPLVSILWGNDAQALAPLLGDGAVIASVHPSPLSARRGFFGSRPFSRVNDLLRAQGAAEIDWSIPDDDVHSSDRLF